MRESRGLLIVVVVVVALAALVWFLNRPEHEPSRLIPDENEPVRFRFSDVSLRSPDLEVSEAEVRGSIRSSYTSWLVVMKCAEPEGCAGELAVEVRYAGGDETRRLSLVTLCDVPDGGEIRFEGLQDPATPIEGIEQLTLEVRERGVSGESSIDPESF